MLWLTRLVNPAPVGLGLSLASAALLGGFYLSVGELGHPCRNQMGGLLLELCHVEMHGLPAWQGVFAVC